MAAMRESPCGAALRQSLDVLQESGINAASCQTCTPDLAVELVTFSDDNEKRSNDVARYRMTFEVLEEAAFFRARPEPPAQAHRENNDRDDDPSPATLRW
jgi:hypothetical protein